MHYKLKVALLIFSGTIAGCHLFAQTADTIQHNKAKYSSTVGSYHTWSVGINGGVSSSYTPLINNNTLDFTSPDIQYSYGAYIKDQITNSFGLQADFLLGKLKTDHSREKYPIGDYIYSTSNTKVNWSASLSGNFIVAHLGIVQPYLTLGGGILNYTSQLYTAHIRKLYSPNTSSSFFVPAGIGLKFNLTRGVNLDLGYQVNFVNSDNLDGYVYGS